MSAMKLLLCVSLAFGKLLLNEEPSPMEGEEEKEIDTFIIVKEADFEKYNVGEHAPCPNPQGFEIVMCTSYMCTECVSDWCVKTCQDWQKEYPTCRCADWPDSKNSYSMATSDEK